MTKYAKIKDGGTLELAPQNKGSMCNYNVNIELMLADGYKPLIEMLRPDDGNEYQLSYAEADGNIMAVWTLIPAAEIEQVPTLEERLTATEDALKALMLGGANV